MLMIVLRITGLALKTIDFWRFSAVTSTADMPSSVTETILLNGTTLSAFEPLKIRRLFVTVRIPSSTFVHSCSLLDRPAPTLNETPLQTRKLGPPHVA